MQITHRSRVPSSGAGRFEPAIRLWYVSGLLSERFRHRFLCGSIFLAHNTLVLVGCIREHGRPNH
jgi:hypothetical protein